MTRGTFSAIVIVCFAVFDAGTMVALGLLDLLDERSLVAVVILAVLSAQAGLADVWLVLGRRPSWPVRLSLVLILDPALAGVISVGTSDTASYWAFLLIFGVQIVLVVVAITSLEIFGFERADERLAGPVSASANPGSQITIRDLLVLVTALSVVAATMVYARFENSLIPQLPDVGLFASWLAAVTVIAAFVAMSFESVALPAILGVAAAAGCGYGLTRSLNQFQDLWLFIGVTAISAIVQIMILSGYRRQGMRLKRRSPAAPRLEPSTAQRAEEVA